MASLILGGGTQGGFLSDAILELVSIPLLLVALWRLFEVPLTKQMRMALSFCAVIVLIPLVQLIPLPPWLWTALPNREVSAETFKILDTKIPWMPLSVSPRETWLSALSLIPPVGIFIATLLLSYRERRWLSLVFLAVGVVSVFLGLLQVAQGRESALRFFAFTNWEEAVGFFANRNHFAALLYALIMFAGAWAVHAVGSSWGKHRRSAYDTASIAAIIGAFTLLVVLLAGETMARSRFGLGLTIIALFGTLALGVSNRHVGSQITPSKLLFAACAVVVIFSVQFALYRIMERFAADPLQDARVPFARNTIEAAIAYMPFGSGLGTFVPVYAMFEKPQDVILDTYANHAHNDLLEFWLNTGILGLVLAGMFMVWLALRSVEIWRKPPAHASELDYTLARAATIVVALLVAHSFFDYPLRTGAMMAVMAFACALLIEPPITEPDEGQELRTDAKRTRRRPTRRLKDASPQKPTSLPPLSLGSSEAPSLPTEQRWAADAGWPEEWTKPSTPRSSPGRDKPSDVPVPPKRK